MRISVELIPRGEAELLRDVHTVKAVMPSVSLINIPDLMHFPVRSWDACKIASPVIGTAIPHIRAIDIPPDGEFHLAEVLRRNNLKEILVIRGDPPHDMSRRTFPNSSEDIIRRLKELDPQLRIYAAFDPYRLGWRDELLSVQRKIDAGADGFFTQPIFDLRLLEICADMLLGNDVYWGIAPVVGDRSRSYWETTNRIVFPSEFLPTISWNRDFARDALQAIEALDGNVYFMPIRVDLAEYLGGLLPS